MSGTVWTFTSLTIERVEVAAGTRLIRHSHEHPQLSLLEHGRVRCLRGGTTDLAAGTLRVSPAGDELDLSFLERSKCIVIVFPGSGLGLPPSVFAVRRFARSEHLRSLLDELGTQLDRDPTDPPVMMLESLALEMIAEATLSTSRPPRSVLRWLTRIRERLEDDPANPPATHELAEHTGLHPVYVARAFRRCYGIGIGEYARRLRARYAHSLLCDSREALADVALRAGYSDQSHLTRSMRAVFETTPGEIRQRGKVGLEVSSVQDAAGGPP